MFPPVAKTAVDEFRASLAVAEQEASRSRIDWAVREADLERRLAALQTRAGNLSRRHIPKLPKPDPVALYSTRWSHSARMSLLLAKC